MNTPQPDSETYALISYSDQAGRTQLAKVEVLDWTEEGEPMVADSRGYLLSAHELPGFHGLTGTGVVPSHLPRGSGGAGRARALLRHEAPRRRGARR